MSLPIFHLECTSKISGSGTYRFLKYTHSCWLLSNFQMKGNKNANIWHSQQKVNQHFYIQSDYCIPITKVTCQTVLKLCCPHHFILHIRHVSWNSFTMGRSKIHEHSPSHFSYRVYIRNKQIGFQDADRLDDFV